MSARDLVTTRIAEQARQFPKLDFSPLETGDLSPRDTALAMAIEHAVMRRWITLRAVLESQIDRAWSETEPRMQAALLVGAAQLLLLDRLPDHAVINETVRWIKDHGRAKAAGFINAVLRKVAALRLQITSPASPADWGRNELPLHDGRVWKLSQPVFEEHSQRRLAAQTSHPEELLTHWLRVHGPKISADLAAHSLVHAPIIVGSLNPAIRPDSSVSPLLQPHETPGFSVFTGERSELAAMLTSHPDLIVQDPTSAQSVLATAALDPPPRLIIDACAGKGTKTRQLAALHPQATIVATDIDPQRFAVLAASFRDHPRVRIVAHGELVKHRGCADLLVLDVPCSNLGVLARRIEAKYRFSAATLQSVTKLQKQIIADSLLLPAPQGRILYSTCSIDPSENQQQAEWVAKWHPFRIVESSGELPRGGPGDHAARYADGGYFALLQRKDA